MPWISYDQFLYWDSTEKKYNTMIQERSAQCRLEHQKRAVQDLVDKSFNGLRSIFDKRMGMLEKEIELLKTLMKEQ